MINYNLKTLKNGIRLVTAPINNTEAVAILILVGTGGRFEPSDKLGISHLLEHLFFKGTKKYPTSQKLSRELDRLGANYNAYTGEETTAFFIQSSANDFKVSLELLSQMYLEPLFSQKELVKEKGVIIEEAKMRKDVPQIHVQVLSQKQMFSNSPLGNDLIGTPQTLASISRSDLLSYYANNYNGSSTVIVVCGNQKGFNWEKEIVSRFSARPEGIKAESEMFSGTKINDPIVVEDRKVDQAHLVLSTRLFSKTDVRRYQAILLKTILGSGMSSRLFSEIREKRSLAYYIQTDTAWFSDTGALTVSAGVNTSKIAKAVQVIIEQFKDIASKGPTTEELSRAKSQIRGQIALSLEDSLEIASYLAEESFFEDQIRQPEGIISQIDKVTSKDVQRLAQDIFNSDKMGLAVIGPKIDKMELENILIRSK